MAWKEFYLAVKNGDTAAAVAGLKNGLNPLICLEGPYSAIDLAAYHGHTDIVRAIVQHAKTMSVKDLESIYLRILYYAGVKGHAEVIRAVIDDIAEFANTRLGVLEHIDFEMNLQSKYLYLALNGTVEVLKEMDRLPYLMGLDYERGPYINAFMNENPGVLKYCMSLENLSPEAVTSEYIYPSEVFDKSPELFIHIALGDLKSSMKIVKKDKDWYKRVVIDYNKLDFYSYLHTDEMSFDDLPTSAIAVAGKFGRTQILKKLVPLARRIPVYDELKRDLTKAAKFAVESRHLDTVKYLVKEGARLPESWILRSIMENDKYADMYDYVWPDEPRCREKQLFSTSSPCDKTTSETREILEQTLYEDTKTPKSVMETNMERYLREKRRTKDKILAEKFEESIEKNKPDVAMVIKEAFDWTCEKHNHVHTYLRTALMYRRYQQRPPSPALLEILLEGVPRGSTCECGDCVFLDAFLEWRKFNTDDYFNEQDELSFEHALTHINAIFKVLWEHGVRPKRSTVRKTFTMFFRDTARISTYMACRLICLMDWLDLEECCPVEIIGAGRWLMSPFKHKNKFITCVLHILCSNKARNFKWNGLLVYIMKDDVKREHFLKLLHELNLKIADRFTTSKLFKAQACHRKLVCSQSKVLSLQSLARLQIYRLCRLESNRARSQGIYKPYTECVREMCEQNLPKTLIPFLQFDEVVTPCLQTSNKMAFEGEEIIQHN